MELYLYRTKVAIHHFKALSPLLKQPRNRLPPRLLPPPPLVLILLNKPLVYLIVQPDIGASRLQNLQRASELKERLRLVPRPRLGVCIGLANQILKHVIDYDAR